MMIILILPVALTSLTMAQFHRPDDFTEIESIRYRRPTPTIPGICRKGAECMVNTDNRIEELFESLDQSSMHKAQVGSPMNVLGSKNFVSTVCEAYDMMIYCMKKCDEGDRDLLDMLQPVAKYLCTDHKEEFEKYLPCIEQAVRNDHLDVCARKCPDFAQFGREAMRDVSVSPSFKTVFGDGGVIDEACEMVSCHVDCAAEQFSDYCVDENVGTLLHGMTNVVFDGAADKLIEYELTGLAPPKCRALAGDEFSKAPSYNSLVATSTGLLVATIVFSVLFVIALAIIALLFVRRPQQKFQNFN